MVYIRPTNNNTIDLRNQNLKSFPNEILQFTEAERLYLSNNRLSSLPREIERLTNLITLDISENKFNKLPPEIGRLTKLTTLIISSNQLNSLPAEIGLLANLLSLDATDNFITSLPPEVGQLINLTKLNLYANQLKALPPEVGRLSCLQEIDLSFNHITVLPVEIGQLTNLTKIVLYRNELSTLPGEIGYLPNLSVLDLENNQLPIPPEMVRRINEPQAVLNYYFSLSAGDRKPLGETKILIVGQGSVGKTSLVQQILYGAVDKDQTKTEGISISQWSIDDWPELETKNQEETSDNYQPIRLNIWDFGGQEIMHATHQFFLTRRSLYVLVLDARLTQEENRVEYWLKIIQSFGGESPVLIVGNKTDQHPLDIDRSGLQKKYPNIVGIVEASAITGKGVEYLKAEIVKQVDTLQHVHDLLPEAWFKIKSRLERSGRNTNFITYEDYEKLCIENNVYDKLSQRTLLSFLHDLGVVLHYQDDPRLVSLGILNPQWVTNGVYKILNSRGLFKNQGMLTLSMLNDVLNLPEYPHDKRLFIVDMMKKFELCYEMPYGYDLEPDKIFLVPDLLPKDQPELDFKGIPAFEYQYPVLPSSVITRFIVRMNQHIHESLVWRSGVMLKIGENLALVKADSEDKTISIAIDGLEHTRRDALAAIRYQLDEIHASIKGLNPLRRVPIPNAPNAEPLEYEYLLMLEREGQNIYLAKDGNRLVKVNIRQLLSGVESEAKRKEISGNVTHIYVGGDVGGDMVVGDENRVNP